MDNNIRIILEEREPPHSGWVIRAIYQDNYQNSFVITSWKKKPAKKTYEETVTIILRCFDVFSRLGAIPILDTIRELARAQVED